MKTEVWFMSGAGNLFTVIDNTKNTFTQQKASQLARDLCNNTRIQRKPTEGLMLLNKSGQSDFECWFFNPDGSSGMMCGNGARCIVKFAKERGILTPHTHSTEFIMNNNRYTCNIEGEDYEIGFDSPLEVKDLHFNNGEQEISGVYVNNSSDHFCIDFKTIKTQSAFDSFPIEELSKMIRKRDFFPRSVNVNFYQVSTKGVVSLRTFERGVDAETGACGTGALATGIAIDRNYDIPRPYTIYPSSKLPIQVDVRDKKHYLKGPAEILGKIEMEL